MTLVIRRSRSTSVPAPIVHANRLRQVSGNRKTKSGNKNSPLFMNTQFILLIISRGTSSAEFTYEFVVNKDFRQIMQV